MIRQFFTLALRNILKDKIFSLINFTNLTIGFATFILVTLIINEELSWDKQNENYNRIYRLQLFMDEPASTTQHTWSVTAALSRHELLNQPEIEKVALLHDVSDNNMEGVFLSPDKKNQFLIRFGYYSDQTIFDILTFKFLEGDFRQALTQPNSIVLSKKVAEQLFPSGKAFGKIIYGENKVQFTVTGVYADFPANSSLNPQYLVPMSSFASISNFKDYETNYWAYAFYTYVLLKPNANPATVDKRIFNALKDYRKEHHPYLRPLSMVHLNPYFQKDYHIFLSIVSATAFFILILSSINYINLQTANATTRLREIGIKKSVGFSKTMLLRQFVGESMLTSFISGLLGIYLAQLSLPLFNKIVGTTVLTNVFGNLSLLGILLLVTIITGMLSGLYPAYVIASYNPVKALKQKFVQDDTNGFSLKKALIVMQFSISLFLLIVSFIVYKQTNYMLTMNMGYERKNLMYANITTYKVGTFDQVRDRLLKHPEIEDACFSNYIPYILPGGDDLTWDGAKSGDKVFVRVSKVSYDYLTTFKMKLATGRNFSREYADKNSCLINETATRIFSWKDPIGKTMKLWGKDYTVVGVMKDYYPYSPHNAIEPHLFRLMTDSVGLTGLYTVRFAPGKEQKAMQIVKDEFERSYPEDVAQFRDYEHLVYIDMGTKGWETFRNITIFLAILSILISSIGLFGLVMFYAKRKLKEIGLRKVFGFSLGSLYFTMTSGFISYILISVILAWPAGYYVYKNLPGATRYPVQIWEFLLATAITLIVALFTISFQVLKASQVDPAQILKDE
ncbi:MAG TPA: ABC transporter permease [Prolixibacteraceae bacterium]|nr:ABC transporter permease [Prolixibacteraceae bacterium]